MSLTLSVCLSVSASVTVLFQIASFFVSRWNRAIVWPTVLHMALFKTYSSIFDLELQDLIVSYIVVSQNLLPKIWHKIADKSASVADRRKCLGQVGDFSGMTDSMKPCKMLWADPCCHGKGNCGKFWLFFSTKTLISRLVYQIDQICLGLQWGDDYRGAIFVAMATTFALGAESNRLLPCLSICPSVCLSQTLLLLFCF